MRMRLKKIIKAQLIHKKKKKRRGTLSELFFPSYQAAAVNRGGGAEAASPATAPASLWGPLLANVMSPRCRPPHIEACLTAMKASVGVDMVIDRHLII